MPLLFETKHPVKLELTSQGVFGVSGQNRFFGPQFSPFPFRREFSEASRGGKRRNSHQSAVFGEAGNGTVAGISELAERVGFEPTSPCGLPDFESGPL